MRTPAWVALALIAIAACGRRHKEAGPAAASFQPLVDATDRSDADRALDPTRKPAEMLAFLEVKPGMKVADLGAGGGYTTELLARAVGPSGVVYGQNPKVFLERFAEQPWSERLAKPVMKNVVRVDREFDAPLPPEAHDLDLVVMNAVYHDSVWMQIDRAKMNRAIFDALRPGGVFVVIDNSARGGSGTAVTETLHRIDEEVVRREVPAAGFKLQGVGDFLRNDKDERDWNVSPRVAGEKRGQGDRFAIRFVKP